MREIDGDLWSDVDYIFVYMPQKKQYLFILNQTPRYEWIVLNERNRAVATATPRADAATHREVGDQTEAGRVIETDRTGRPVPNEPVDRSGR